MAVAVSLLILSLGLLGPVIRRDFFPEVDAGAFEIYVRAPTGTRIERTEAKIAERRAGRAQAARKRICRLIVSEIGVVADWSAAYTPNSGPMDAVVKVQLDRAERERSAQEYVEMLRQRLDRPRFAELEFALMRGV